MTGHDRPPPGFTRTCSVAGVGSSLVGCGYEVANAYRGCGNDCDVYFSVLLDIRDCHGDVPILIGVPKK